MSLAVRTRTARLARCLVVVLLAIGAAWAPIAAEPAAADPTAGPARATPLPVAVELTAISPTLSVADEPVAIQAKLTNNGDEAVTDPWIRLQRDQRVTGRAQLQAMDDKQPTYTSQAGDEQDLELTLQPGATVTVELTVPRSALQIFDGGAYPILLNVQGSIDGVEGRVGQAAFLLPRSTAATAPPVTVSWVLPLIDQPHRLGGSDVFVDETLTTLVSDGGRLENLLSAAEKYAANTALTLVVDPELIDALVAMSDGYQVADGAGYIDGVGAENAAAFLDRLRDVVETTPVIATPYADVDTVALVRSGLADLVVAARAQGEAIVAEALDTTPLSGVAWPADGIMTDAAWEVLRQDGVDTVLLGGQSFGQDDYLESGDGITEDAATVLPGGRAVVADPGLSRVLSEAPQYVAGPVAARQRLAAELAVVAAQAPQRERAVVLVPPRRWAASEELLDDLLGLTGQSPWINPAPLDQVAGDPPQDRGPLEYPAAMSSRELPAAQLAALPPLLTQITELSTAFDPDDADAAFLPARSAIQRAASSAWRGGDGSQTAQHAGAANDELSYLRSQIRIVTPGGGTYTLASSDAPLVFTVENNLPWDVHYRIGVDETRSAGLTTEDIGVQTIPAGTRATVQLPTSVERSGAFTVVAQISTPEGRPLGNDVQINVSSSAYGTAALWATGVAFALLLMLIARRWWRRHLFWAAERRKRAAADEHQRLEHSSQYGGPGRVDDGYLGEVLAPVHDSDPHPGPPPTDSPPTDSENGTR